MISSSFEQRARLCKYCRTVQPLGKKVTSKINKADNPSVRLDKLFLSPVLYYFSFPQQLNTRFRGANDDFAKATMKTTRRGTIRILSTKVLYDHVAVVRRSVFVRFAVYGTTLAIEFFKPLPRTYSRSRVNEWQLDRFTNTIFNGGLFVCSDNSKNVRKNNSRLI